MGKTKKILLKVFASRRTKKVNKGLWIRLKKRGVREKFANTIAKFEGANERLLQLKPKLINKVIELLIGRIQRTWI